MRGTARSTDVMDFFLLLTGEVEVTVAYSTQPRRSKLWDQALAFADFVPQPARHRVGRRGAIAAGGAQVCLPHRGNIYSAEQRREGGAQCLIVSALWADQHDPVVGRG